MTSLDTRAVGTGIAIGAGVGSTLGLLVDESLALGAGYGIAVGIIVGALLARLVPRIANGARPKLTLVGGGLILGLVVGVLVGAVGAWGTDAALASGGQAGGAGGAVVGVLVGGILAASIGNETVAEGRTSTTD